MSGALAGLAAAWRRERIDVGLVAVDEIDSTQRLARALLDRHLADDERPPACCVVALAQTGGRGRRGRAWQSAPGKGVWATLLLDTQPETLGAVPLRTATALAEALAVRVAAVRIKWPNDLVVDGRKLGGILVETVLREPGQAWALVGFGVNVDHRADELPTAQATSLRVLGVSGTDLALPALTSGLVVAVWRELRADREDWLERYRDRSAHRPGDRIECDLDGEHLAGELLGFDAHGAMRLRSAQGERTISSGDVYSW